ncbi:FAD-binding protein [Deinococcus yavapaiensis]|uniref:Xylitol oxidase n=1 Tax=Deinococcus yavapaiensis KR-236 TaxID=694435 RepID=A0A318S482_9DEIO|nr:FAD-binding protein [Deinococcus yavapaiensis]PYE53246.1 xylitol oxidase [Deinococcus yavapaiensis KR-236]
MARERNWAGNVEYDAARWHAPTTVDEVRQIVRNADRVRSLGTRHTFNDLANTAADLLSTHLLNRVVALDEEARTVTIEGGVRYGELGRFLHARGFALHNLASLPHISVVGACATATHGSGDRAGNLATAVTALELVTASGDVETFSRASHPDVFSGMVVNLGALGVVTKATLRVEAAFDVRQDVFEDLAFEAFEQHLDDVTGAADSVSFFTDWKEPLFHQVWHKRRIGEERFEPTRTWFGARRATSDLHPLRGFPATSCTPQLGVPGPWHERLPHFRLEFTPSVGEELQSEFFVPRRHAPSALRAVRELRAVLADVLLVSELRTVAADDLWLSPCFKEACVGFHFTWRRDEARVRTVLPRLQEALAEFDARPHWGKLFTTAPRRLREVFVKLPDFQRLAETFDPTGKFRNAFVEGVLSAR